MDNRTLNRLEPGDLIKRPNGLILEFVKVEAYTRGRPSLLRFTDPIDGGKVLTLMKLHVLESLLITTDSKEYLPIKALFSKSQF